MRPLLDILVVTYNNPKMLVDALNSIWLSTYGPAHYLTRLIVVNNGAKESVAMLKQSENLVIVQADENRGWEGGLKLGLEKSSAPFVAFSNDDIRFIPGQKDWFWKMMCMFNDPKVAAVGPSSNFVAGAQNIFWDIEEKCLDVRYLIGLFMVVRRSALMEAGGVDDTLRGGDDIDLSIRLRDSGYRLVCRRDVFVFHHGQVTGKKVHGGYWDSEEHQRISWMNLIRKHGMKKFWETWVIGYQRFQPYSPWKWSKEDTEAKICADYATGENILELGCGGLKTVPNAMGVDLYAPGTLIPGLSEGRNISVADYVGDVSIALPVPEGSQDSIIARHILEHCQDPLQTLAVWNGALKIGGRLIVAVPDNSIGNTIVLNPEHVVSFVPSSLSSLARVSGFKEIAVHTDINGVSFVSVFEKVGLPVEGLTVPEATVAPRASRLEPVPA